MNKTELMEAVLKKGTGFPKTSVEKVLNDALDSIHDALVQGEKVTITCFGTFEVVERKARVGRNPQNGKPVDIPASRAVKFKPGKQLKDAVKG